MSIEIISRRSIFERSISSAIHIERRTWNESFKRHFLCAMHRGGFKLPHRMLLLPLMVNQICGRQASSEMATAAHSVSAKQVRTDWSAESLAVLANALIIFISYFMNPRN